MRKTRYALVLAGTAALALPAGAMAAAPVISSVGAQPSNPRSTTPTNFTIYGHDPDDKATEFAFDFAGGTAFGAFQGDTLEGVDHTFGTAGVRWITGRLKDAAGEATDTRFPFATHPDNWNPVVMLEGGNLRDNYKTEGEHSLPQRLHAFVHNDDSPESGITLQWDLNGDGTFNGAGDGDAVESSKYARDAHFTTDGEHPIKVKALDGEGGEAVVSGVVRTHTDNEPPFMMSDPYFSTFIKNDVENAEAYFYLNWNDDWTSFSDLTFEWKIDGNTIAGQTFAGLELPTDLSLGTHTVTVKASDNGAQAGETGLEPTGEVQSVTKTFEIEVIEAYSFPAEISASSSVGDHGATTYRTLENINLYAFGASNQEVTDTVWDLDGDGQFDDARGYGTYFAAANKGSYKVSAQLSIQGGSPVTLERTLVVDQGVDYAPVNNNPGGNTPPPVTGGPISSGITPEQAKAAMLSLLTSETLEFLREIAKQNKKGIDPRKPVLNLGTIGTEQLPNGGTAQFRVFDKPGAKKATASAKKKKKSKKRVTLGATTVKLTKGQKKSVKVKLNKKGKALLRKKGKVKLSVDAVLTDALTGAKTTQSRTVTIKVKKAKKKKK